MKKRYLVLALAIVVIAAFAFFYLIAGFLAGYGPPPDVGERPIDFISLPDGFSIEVYAEVPNARSMALSDNGVLFVGTRDSDKVYAIVDSDVKVIASGLNMPNGVALKDGSLYVAEINRIVRFDNIEQHLDNASYTVVNDDFPSDKLHGWKFIRFGPDGKLYVPIGAPCNVCLKEGYAKIMRMNPDGTELEEFASGIRNTVGFDWHPETNELWFTDNGRDWMGDDIPPDELNYAPIKGMHFGFPYCHGNLQDPEFTDRGCDEFIKPALELGPHVAALGMRFYTGEMFPEYYKHGIFIAEHGSWNRKIPIGYRVMFVKIEDNKPVSYEIFAEGWLQGSLSWGRPVDIEVMKDGSLLISDDKAGLIYRVIYEKENK
ncbi:MAG: sorbosone dehydrogenase family protein [Asgard group archaeon]